MGGGFLWEVVAALSSWRTQNEFLRCDLVFEGEMEGWQRSVDPQMCLSIDLSLRGPCHLQTERDPTRDLVVPRPREISPMLRGKFGSIFSFCFIFIVFLFVFFILVYGDP